MNLVCLSCGRSDLSRIIRVRAVMACLVGRLQMRCRQHPVRRTKEERRNPRKVLAEQSRHYLGNWGGPGEGAQDSGPDGRR